MKFKRQVQAEDGVNLTPLIDVVFLLLIFFMVSTTFTKETHLSVDLPEAAGEASTDNAKGIDVVIGLDGHYAVNGRPLIKSDLASLKAALFEVAGDDRTQSLTITADANTPHQAVVTAMDAAGQLGFVKLSISTRQPDGDA